MEDQRQVSFQEGKDYADFLGVEFLETSAKNKTNIEETFETLSKGLLVNNMKKSKGKNMTDENTAFAVDRQKGKNLKKDCNC